MGSSTAKSTARLARRYRLRPEVGLRLLYLDDTPYGSAISGGSEAGIRRRFAALHAYREKFGLQQLVRESCAVLARVIPTALADIRINADQLRDDWLYPPAHQVVPAYLRIERNVSDLVAQFPLPQTLRGELASWLGDWQAGAQRPRSVAAAQLWDALLANDALTTDGPPRRTAHGPRVSFIGHATLGFHDGQQQLLIDPFLLPRSTHYPRHWQPPSHASIGAVDAVFITHSHPDHFDLGSLLRMGADVPIYVPHVERESVLSIDMAARLRELGFRAVHALTPWQRIRVGRFEVQALPFYGEQPTVDDVLHPEVRNIGLTYAITHGQQRMAILADAGRDRCGDTLALASQMHKDSGGFDTVFGGYRGFAVYPVQYLFSSVGRYLPFVPPSLWGARQRIMCDAEALIDVGERFGARRVVPYADGGAPWYWQRGLGPNLERPTSIGSQTDPPPSVVKSVAAQRSHTHSEGALASPLEVLVMKVGRHLPLNPIAD